MKHTPKKTGQCFKIKSVAIREGRSDQLLSVDAKKSKNLLSQMVLKFSFFSKKKAGNFV